jgi:hypothetical protein
MAKKPRIKKSSALKVVKTVARRVDNFVAGTNHSPVSPNHPIYRMQGLTDSKFKDMQGE